MTEFLEAINDNVLIEPIENRNEDETLARGRIRAVGSGFYQKIL